jgi:hypothetical protein
LKDELQEKTPWLNALRHLDTATPGEAERIGPVTASTSADEISEVLTQQGAKSASRMSRGLLALPYTRNLE